MRILGIESSCDETAAAVVSGGRTLSSLVATQHDVHERYGGVVPELASRRHMENIVPLIRGALDGADLSLDDIDGIAATFAPGLVGSLLVGLMAAKSIAYSRGLPFVGVNHLEGHLSAAALEYGPIPTPHVGLVVSGGHTSLYLVREGFQVGLLGATRDDAAGEAFDKVAKLLGLGYPGGPAIERAAESGDPAAIRFTRPKFADDDSMDFSFSGIKTACLLRHRKEAADGRASERFVADMAASFQESVASILVERTIEGARRSGAKAAVLSGGVAANRRLRELFAARCDGEGISHFIPPHELCTDNAAMIAFVGERKLSAGIRSDFSLNAVANMEIGV
ncbi:MAG: tRNA (adenosine(37)-N6)-threonylcarbamoyltransferase complex transferase subunit TsaD [Proteobacteria bacterium]|nr:tRNA (adenosine(37)-N6)-threonylcarbamoyltransferase complex transferase subunit TsaD [Pseudomonadota bacterium]